MSNDYDKIIKENIEELIPFITNRLLGFKLKKSRSILGKIQETIEREPDFLSKVETDTGEKFILQIEFQTRNDRTLPHRMMEYHAILVKRYKMEVRQYVVFLDDIDVAKITTSPPPEQMFKGYTVTSLRKMDYRKLLESNVPEEVMLAILGDFGEEPKRAVVRSITNRLREISKDPVLLEKQLYQLGVLSRIRKMEQLTFKIVNTMPITINVTQDYLYKTGLKKGREEGRDKGREEGREDGREEIVANFIKKHPDYSDWEVSDQLGVEIDFVRKCRVEMVLE